MTEPIATPDKNWSKEDLALFIEEHNIHDAMQISNHFQKLAIVKKWVEKNMTTLSQDSQEDENDDTEDDENKEQKASVRMTDTYFDIDRSRTFIELEVMAKSKQEAFDFIAQKEKSLVEKFNIKRANGESDITIVTQALNDNLVRASIEIPTQYMRELIREAIINA